jgi:tripartite-type tricarboxylate transporter receptor subunit TctC
MRSLLLLVGHVLIASSLFGAQLSSAQAFPSKPIRIISPTSPGGLNDALSRLLAAQIAESVGHPVVVENRAGGGSMIGMSALAKSPPDGYTVAVTTPEALIYNPLLYTKLPYDADNDFSYVTQLTRNFGLIVASAGAPGDTFAEIISHAKQHPGVLNWATWGPGSTPAIYLEWAKRQNRVDIVAIPYKGVGPTIPALAAGQVHVAYLGLASALPLIRAGKVKALAITGSRSSPALPGVLGLAQYNSDPGIVSEFGAYAPARTPAAVLDRLSTEFAKALKTPALRKFMGDGMAGVGNTPAEFSAASRAKKQDAITLFRALAIRPSEAPE